MKNKILYIGIIYCSLWLGSCQVDNFKGPDSQFFGRIIDDETNEPIQQDLILGSVIDLIELGYPNPPIQQLRFNTDGTFRDNNLFSGTYEVQAVRGNFTPTEKETVKIQGATEHDFRSLPYIRIKNVSITFDELKGKVIATCNLERVSPNAVASISLIADKNPNVAWNMRGMTVTQAIGTAVSAETVFKIEMSSLDLASGTDYYFRIAALIANVGEAKHNYSEAIKLSIDNSKVVPEEPDKGKILDDCESLTGWGSGGFTLSLDGNDKKQGDYSLKADGTGVVIYQKVFTPFDTEVTKATGYLAFSLYVSDVSLISSAAGQIEITSSGQPDVQELSWPFSAMDLHSGWNNIELKLSAATQDSGVNLRAINFMRIYHTGLTGSMIFKLDNVRFY
jgi:hypothetical protein